MGAKKFLKICRFPGSGGRGPKQRRGSKTAVPGGMGFFSRCRRHRLGEARDLLHLEALDLDAPDVRLLVNELRNARVDDAPVHKQGIQRVPHARCALADFKI